MSLRGMFSGLLALTLIQAVLSSTKSAERTAGLLKGLSSGVAHFMSPTVAAIPDLRDRRKTVAPGPLDDGRIPFDQSSSTLPTDWTTKAAPPKTVQA